MKPSIPAWSVFLWALFSCTGLLLISGCAHQKAKAVSLISEIEVIGLLDSGSPTTLRFVKDNKNWGVVDLALPSTYLKQVAKSLGRTDILNVSDIHIRFSPDYKTSVLVGIGATEDNVLVPIGVVFKKDKNQAVSKTNQMMRETERHLCKGDACACCRFLFKPQTAGIAGCDCNISEIEPCSETPGQKCKHTVSTVH